MCCTKVPNGSDDSKEILLFTLEQFAFIKVRLVLTVTEAILDDGKSMYVNLPRELRYEICGRKNYLCISVLLAEKLMGPHFGISECEGKS